MAKDADLLKARPDATAVAKAESAEAETSTAGDEPADAELEKAAAVVGLSANHEPSAAAVAKAEPAKAVTAEAEPADAELDEAETAVAEPSAKAELEVTGAARAKRKARLAEAAGAAETKYPASTDAEPVANAELEEAAVRMQIH